MSKETTPNKGSPQKHKGMKTSLYPNEQAYRQPGTTIYTKPQRIFVQTVNEQPNVMPYIDSQYTNQPQMFRQYSFQDSQSHSQYVPVIDRQNNFVRDARQLGGMQNVFRVSPLQGSHAATNFSRTNVEYIDHNRFHNAGSTFVPPPPESFLINNSKLPQHRSPSMGKTMITVSPPPPITTNFQSIKKTYVPHHIINEIPVYGNGSVYAQSGEQGSGVTNNDESQQVLMGYYEKLYAKYETEKQQSQATRQQLNDAVNQINYLQSQRQSNQTVVHQTIVKPQKHKVIDRQRLHDLLSQKWNRIVDEVVERRKQSCISQVSKMVESCKVTIKISGEMIERQQSREAYYVYE